MNTEIEIWKDIPGYEGLYQASTLGRIKSLERPFLVRRAFIGKVKERILKGSVKKESGYIVVGLYKNGIAEITYVHKLIVVTFLNHVPCGYQIVTDHINGIRHDNRLENLQLITHRENISKDKRKIIIRSSKYIGVHWHKVSNKWQAAIRIKSKTTYLGIFADEYDAHLAYQNKLKEIENL